MKLFLLSFLTFPALLFAQKNPIELGDVHWLRTMPEAIAQSKQQNKPILILFQEVPGCETCRNYGNDVLTHPLIVEAIETEFIPLCIFNNKSGHDAEILKRYNEPSWNNPVVRIVDSRGENIVSRVNGNYSSAGLTGKMCDALISVDGKAPAYLNLLVDELNAEQSGTATTTYSMHCFWTGEALFGKLNGVVKTTAGFQSGKEVVAVEYNPQLISRAQLDKIALNQSCAISSEGTFRKDSTPKYYLSNSKYRVIPMTELQKCRVNSALGEGLSPEEFLSPRQIAFLHSGAERNAIELSLVEGWQRSGLH